MHTLFVLSHSISLTGLFFFFLFCDRLAYLHEGLEPKVVHRDVKSSNILLDRKWNPKVSDFGLAKLLVSEKSYVTTRVMGTFGYALSLIFPNLYKQALSRLFTLIIDNYCDRYVSPDYASTGMLNEGSDVYSFGVMLMEIITGRSPVDYSRPPGEVRTNFPRSFLLPLPKIYKENTRS